MVMVTFYHVVDLLSWLPHSVAYGDPVGGAEGDACPAGESGSGRCHSFVSIIYNKHLMINCGEGGISSVQSLLFNKNAFWIFITFISAFPYNSSH